MGYSYCGGLLYCDFCGQTGGVRKHRCPFGWCPKIALCPRCKAEHPEILTKDYHRKHGNCEEYSSKFKAEEKKRMEIITSGKLLRTSALQHKTRKGLRIKVIFRGNCEKVRAFWMAPRTYRRLGCDTPTTLEDYQAIGKVTRARNTDIYDSEGR